MPIYEYQCKACGHELDALQKLSEAPLVNCPECEEDALRRMISAPQFRLKGSGWYETDFKQDKRRNLADGGDAGQRDKGQGDKGERDKGQGDKGQGDKGKGDKGQSGKSGADKAAGNDDGRTADKKPAAGESGTAGKASMTDAD